MNKKPYGPEYDFKEAIVDFARDIALIKPNPVDWRESDVLHSWGMGE